MASREIIRNFSNFGGIDLRTSELLKERIFATAFLNARQKDTTSIEKRPGWKYLSLTGGRFGTENYTRVDLVTGLPVSELISLDVTPNKAISSTLTISYTGAATLVLFNTVVSSTTNTFRAQISADSVSLLDFDLGTAVAEVTPVTLANLKTAIDAIANFTATISGSTTFPAALLPITVDGRISTATPIVINYIAWSPINTTVVNPLLGSFTNRGEDSYENCSSVSLNNVLYVTNGYNFLQKYDGQTFYRAGAPKPSDIATISLGGTGWSDAGSRYRYYYVQKDAQGNFIEGEWSEASALTAPTNQTASVTVQNIQAATGFNTNCALVNGVQSGVNVITVTNSPHTMQMGDTAYFFDGVTSRYVERVVTNRTTTSITVAGAAVNVASAIPISNNLRIKLIRTLNGGAEYNEVSFNANQSAEVPNNSFVATQVYADTNGLVGAVLPNQIVRPSLPPIVKYLAVHQNTLCLAGDPKNPSTVTFADIDFPEGFDALRRSFDCVTDQNEPIRGIGSANEIFAVFKTSFSRGSIFIVSGVIQLGQYRVDLLTKNLGCVSHQSIKEIEGYLYFLSERGVYRFTSGQLPEEVSGSIRPIFSQPILNTQRSFVFRRSISVVDTKTQKYLLFLPDEEVFDSYKSASSFSRVWSYDYFRLGWAEWSNLDFSAGATVLNDEVWFTGRRADAPTSTVQSYAAKFGGLNLKEDYADHNLPVNWQFGSVWEALESTATFKVFLRTKLLALEPVQSPSFRFQYDQEINYISGSSVTSAIFELGGGGFGYGLSAYGVDPYGDPSSSLEPIAKNVAVKAKSSRFLLSNNILYENVTLSGYEMEVALPYVQRGLKD